MTVPLNNFVLIQLIVWTIALISLIILFFLYIQQYRRTEIAKRTYFFSLALFCLFFFVFRTLTIYYNYFLEGGLIGSQVPDLDTLALFFWAFNFCFGCIGITFLLFAVEKEIFRKSKYIFTIALLVLISLFLIFVFINIEIASYIQWLIPIPFLIVPLLYFYVGIKSSGEYRMHSFKMFVGILLLFISHGIFSIVSPNWEVLDMYQLLYISSPILMIGAMIIIISLERKK